LQRKTGGKIVLKTGPAVLISNPLLFIFYQYTYRCTKKAQTLTPFMIFWSCCTYPACWTRTTGRQWAHLSRSV